MQISCITSLYINFIEADQDIHVYKVWTKYYYMQQYFDGPVDLNRDEDRVKVARFLKVAGYDRQKHNPQREVDIWRGRTRYGWWNSRGKEH